jgi:WD40 repeat protein/serine/threonine protein kinase
MDANTPTLTGQTLKGYQLKELIGSGGFGSVYRAVYPPLRREVAVKIILPEYANEEHFIRRFETEAQVVARLEHLHIVPLYDYWREPDNACLVMRWLQGGSLEGAITNHGSWPLQDAARLVDQIAAALAVAHRNGIVHRDLKPANILLDEEKNAYLADFGIAKNILLDQEITDEDRFGSPEYISPEQVMGQPVSPQTDIYSLGVVLYMMLTGRTPFSESTTTAVIRRHLSDTLPPLQATHPDLPHGLNAVIWRATAKRPEQRYPDSLAMAADVRRVIGGQTTIGTMSTRVGMSPQVILSPVGQTIPVDIPLEPENPYKGLRAFQEADQGDFYGRKKLVEQLLKRLSEDSQLRRFLAVIGPSGSGKSSVVKAGLIPAIRRGSLRESDSWFITQMTPGAQPFQELAAALLKVSRVPLENLTDTLRASPDGLQKVAAGIAPQGLLLVIDQFEELFTLTASPEERLSFLKCITAAATNGLSNVWIIVTLRADYYDRPLLYPEFGEMLRERTLVVLPLSSAETEEAITGPAERYSLRFEPGLVSQIVADVGNVPGGLPLLQFALTALFDQRSGYTMTHAGYETTGGVLQSLGRRAESIYESLDPAKQRMARQVFLQLISTQDDREDTRKRIRRARLQELAGNQQDMLDAVLETFVHNRLLTFDYEPQTRAPVVEVAHEALFRVWDRLKQWVETAQADLHLYHQLEVAADDWEKSSRDSNFLARGARLEQFEELAASPVLPLTDHQREFITAGDLARKRARQRLIAGVVGLAVVALVSLGLAIFALDRQNAAELERQSAATQLQIAQASDLATSALMQIRSEPDLSLLLSLASLNAVDSVQGRSSLLDGLQTYPQLERQFQGYANPINALDQSPDGRWLVSGHENGSVIFWDVETGSPAGDVLAAHAGPIQQVRFSPDGLRLATSGTDQRVRLWDVPARTQLFDLEGHANAVRGLGYSLDGRWLASGDDDGIIIVWEALTGEPIATLRDAEGFGLSAVVFSPQGQWLAAGGGDNRVRLWDTATWQLAQEPLAGHPNWVRDVQFLSDDVLASAGSDGQVLFWSVPSGELLSGIVTDHAQERGVWRLAFSPDRTQVMTVSQDQTAQRWEIATGQPIGEPLNAHTAAVRDARFAADGHSLFTAGMDARLLQWKLDTPNVLATLLPFGVTDVDNPPTILSVAMSLDGRYAASSGGESRPSGGAYAITIWEVSSGAVVQTLLGHQNDVVDLKFTRTSESLVSSSTDQSIRVWDVATGENTQTFNLPIYSAFVPLAVSPDDRFMLAGALDGSLFGWELSTGAPLTATFAGHTDEVHGLAFSPDGRRLASASFDGSIRLWDAGSWELIRTLDAIPALYSQVIFSPDGQTLITGDREGVVRFWDAETGLPDGREITLGDEVSSLSISGDGRTLLTAVYGNEIQLWQVERESVRPLGGRLRGHQDRATAAVISQDATRAITGGADRLTLLWATGLDAWQQAACQRVNRNLYSQEVNRYAALAQFGVGCSPTNQ